MWNVLANVYWDQYTRTTFSHICDFHLLLCPFSEHLMGPHSCEVLLDTQGSLGRCGMWPLPSRDLQSVNIRKGTGQSLKDHLRMDIPPDKTASCSLQSVFGESDFRRVLFLPWTMNEDSWSFQKWDSLTWKLKKRTFSILILMGWSAEQIFLMYYLYILYLLPSIS